MKNPFLVIYLGLPLLMLVTLIVFISYTTTKEVDDETIASNSRDDFITLCSKEHSYSAKKVEFDLNFKNKFVSWHGTFLRAGEADGVYYLYVKMCDDTLISDAMISFDDDKKDSLLELKNGDSVYFQALLTGYGETTGVQGKQGKILNNK